MILPSNTCVAEKKRLIALSQSSPQGTRVLARGDSGWESPESHGGTSMLRFLSVGLEGQN